MPNPVMPPNNDLPHTVGLSDIVIQQISTVFAHYPQIERAIIFGSRAKGNYRPGSDIDIALTGAGLTDHHLLELDNQLDDLLLPYSIDLCRLENLHNPALIEHIQRIGINFYHAAHNTHKK